MAACGVCDKTILDDEYHTCEYGGYKDCNRIVHADCGKNIINGSITWRCKNHKGLFGPQ